MEQCKLDGIYKYKLKLKVQLTLEQCGVRGTDFLHSGKPAGNSQSALFIHGSLAHADSTNPGLWNLDHVVFPTGKKKWSISRPVNSSLYFSKVSCIIWVLLCYSGGFPCGSVVKNPPANAGDTGDTALILGLGRSPGEGIGNPLQFSCLMWLLCLMETLPYFCPWIDTVS